MSGEKWRGRSFSYGLGIVTLIYMVGFAFAFWDREIGTIKVSEMGILFLWVFGIFIVISIGLGIIYIILKESE